jgi:hypothetical protein
MRLARAGCGGVDYWMGLPIDELSRCLLELVEQLKAEADAEQNVR